jgi:hypothetical protein
MDDPKVPAGTPETKESSCVGWDPSCGTPEDLAAVTTLKKEHAEMLIAENLLLTRSNQRLQETADVRLDEINRLQGEIIRLSALCGAPVRTTESKETPVNESVLGRWIERIVAGSVRKEPDAHNELNTSTLRRVVRDEIAKLFQDLGR